MSETQTESGIAIGSSDLRLHPSFLRRVFRRANLEHTADPFYLHFTGSRYLSNGEAYSQTYTPVMSLSIRRTHEDSDLVNEGKSE